MEKRIKVAYICHFSNKKIHDSLPLRLDLFTRFLFAKNHMPQNTEVHDFAVWNTNAIYELGKFHDNVELHVVAPYKYLKPTIFKYVESGVYFHFFRSIDDYFPMKIIRRILHKRCTYKRNRIIIKKLLIDIAPDIVHFVGAENPYYSLSAVDISNKIPVIVQLQTLLNVPELIKRYNNDCNYIIQAETERMVLNRANYIGFSSNIYNQIILEKINKDAIFVKTVLALAEPVDISVGEKRYDFVYFSIDISKAVDLAIEAFIIAAKKIPNITLNIVGGYSEELRSKIERQLLEVNLIQNVYFSGKLSSHEDVIRQIRLSRFALLPLKIDLVSGTIREAMANGLPVVTTITKGTPLLNKKSNCVLLSEIGDHQGLAGNMCKLLEQPELANTLRMNGGNYMEVMDSNAIRIKNYVDVYNAVLKHFHEGIPIQKELLLI